jgi:hypothetical protein
MKQHEAIRARRFPHQNHPVQLNRLIFLPLGRAPRTTQLKMVQQGNSLGLAKLHGFK